MGKPKRARLVTGCRKDRMDSHWRQRGQTFARALISSAQNGQVFFDSKDMLASGSVRIKAAVTVRRQAHSNLPITRLVRDYQLPHGDPERMFLVGLNHEGLFDFDTMTVENLPVLAMNPNLKFMDAPRSFRFVRDLPCEGNAAV